MKKIVIDLKVQRSKGQGSKFKRTKFKRSKVQSKTNMKNETGDYVK